MGKCVAPLSSHSFIGFYCHRIRARKEDNGNCYAVSAWIYCLTPLRMPKLMGKGFLEAGTPVVAGRDRFFLFICVLSICFHSDTLTSWGFADSERLLLPGLANSQRADNSPGRAPLICKLTNLKTIPQPLPLSGSYRAVNSGNYPPALITPGLGTTQPRALPIPQSPLKVFWVNLLSLPHCFLPMETTRRALAHHLPSLPLPPD